MLHLHINNTPLNIPLIIEDNITILKLKELIITEYNIQSEYIDIEIIIDKPIRVLGKFNIEPGILPRTLDRYEIERFAFSNKEIPINIIYHEVNDYNSKVNTITSTNEKYIPPYKKNIINDTNNINSVIADNCNFNINSNSDFPPLK